MPATTQNQINRELETVINHNPHLLKNKLHFNPQNGRVLLHGNVESYFQKQMAQEAIRNINGINEIQNDLSVTWS